MIGYTLADGLLTLAGQSSPVELGSKVYEALAFRDVVVVLVVPTGPIALNVYGVNASGRIIWRVPEPNHIQGSFSEIRRSDDNTVTLYHPYGALFHVDVKTGKVKSSEFVK